MESSAKEESIVKSYEVNVKTVDHSRKSSMNSRIISEFISPRDEINPKPNNSFANIDRGLEVIKEFDELKKELDSLDKTSKVSSFKDTNTVKEDKIMDD